MYLVQQFMQEIWKTLIGTAMIALQSSLMSAPIVALTKHFLQALFFTCWFTYGSAFLLKLIHFQYHNFFADSKIFKLMAVIFFYYVSIWDVYSSIFAIIGYISTFILSFYVFDACCNINTAYKRQRKEIQFIMVLAFSVGFIIYLLYRLEDVNFKYQHLAFLPLSVVIIVVTLIQKQNIFLPFLIIALMGFMVVTTNLETFATFPFTIFPLQALPYLMMAYDAEKKQRICLGHQNEESVYTNFFYSSTSFYLYCLMDNRNIPIQLYVGVIAIVTIALKRCI